MSKTYEVHLCLELETELTAVKCAAVVEDWLLNNLVSEDFALKRQSIHGVAESPEAW